MGKRCDQKKYKMDFFNRDDLNINEEPPPPAPTLVMDNTSNEISIDTQMDEEAEERPDDQVTRMSNTFLTLRLKNFKLSYQIIDVDMEQTEAEEDATAEAPGEIGV